MAIPTPAPVGVQTGLFPELGESLQDQGIDFHGIYGGLFTANPTAGVQPGNMSSLQAFVPEVDLDLDKLLGIKGGSLHVVESFFLLRTDSPQAVLQTGGFQVGWASTVTGSTTTLSELSYEQKLLNDNLDIEFGRTGVYRYFFIPNSLDALTGISYTLYVDGDIAEDIYPVWGGRVAYHLTPNWFVQSGAFEDNYIRAFNLGYDLGDSDANGVQLLNEIDYRSNFLTERYPANLEVGVEYNTAGSNRSNVKGQALNYNPIFAPKYTGGGVLYMQGEKVLWRAATAGFLPANIALYGSFDAAVDKPQPVDLDAVAGVNFTGLLPGRPLDALGVQVHYARLSQGEADRESLFETFAAGQRITQSRNSYAFELIGNVALTNWAFLQPYARYFVTPDAYFFAYQGRAHDGVAAGAYLTISLGTLLGTSKKLF